MLGYAGYNFALLPHVGPRVVAESRWFAGGGKPGWLGIWKPFPFERGWPCGTWEGYYCGYVPPDAGSGGDCGGAQN